MSEREKTPPTVILRPNDRAKNILPRAATGTPTARATGSPPRGGGPSSRCRRRRRVVHSVRISSDWVSRAIARADRLHSAARFSSRFPISESSTHTCRMRTIIIIINICIKKKNNNIIRVPRKPTALLLLYIYAHISDNIISRWSAPPPGKKNRHHPSAAFLYSLVVTSRPAAVRSAPRSGRVNRRKTNIIILYILNTIISVRLYGIVNRLTESASCPTLYESCVSVDSCCRTL